MDCDVEGYICEWSAPIGFVTMNLRDGLFVTDITCLAMGALDSAAIMTVDTVNVTEWRMLLMHATPLTLEVYGDPVLFGYGCLSVMLCAEHGHEIVRRARKDPLKSVRESRQLMRQKSEPLSWLSRGRRDTC